MKRKLILFLKNHKVFYLCYFYIGSFLINIMKYFVKVDPKLILFVSFGGISYGDSPRVIYEQMLQDSRFQGYRLVWAFDQPSKMKIKGGGYKVKIDTLQYFILALKARCWITDVSIERALSFKSRHVYYFCTWHGVLTKKIGFDAKSEDAFVSPGKCFYDRICAQGNYEVGILSHAFHIPKDKILMSGLPRNDELKNASEEDRKNIRSKLKIDQTTKVILYAPTFRDNNRTSMTYQPNFAYWKQRIGEDIIILYRTHPTVTMTNTFTDTGYVKDVSSYNNLNELLIAADILISDYSSIIFDYAVMAKPVYYFTYDYEEFTKMRGVYFDIRNEIPGGSSEEELMDSILDTYPVKAKQSAETLRDKYAEISGNATKISMDDIYTHITS